MNQIFDAMNLFTSIFEITGDAERHDIGMKQETHLHDEEIHYMNEQHKRERFIEKQIYLLSVYADIEAYCQELNENLIQNNRDAERDMVDQRNQQLQTVLIAGTIMVSAIVGVLFQAAFPTDYYEITYYLYAISVAVSMFALVISIILCIELLVRIYRFTYKRSFASIQHLQRSIKLTNKIDEKIAGSNNSGFGRSRGLGGNNITLQPPLHTAPSPLTGTTGTATNGLNSPIDQLPVSANAMQQQTSASSSSLHNRGKQLTSRNFSALNAEEIELEFKKHEEEVEKYFRRRDTLNAELHRLTGGRKELSFETYWNYQCDSLNQIAVQSFYWGTAWNVIATAIFMYAFFDREYGVVECSYAIAAVMGISLIGMFVLVYALQTDPVMKQLYKNILKAESELVSVENGHIVFGNQTKLNKDFMKASEAVKRGGGRGGVGLAVGDEEDDEGMEMNGDDLEGGNVSKRD